MKTPYDKLANIYTKYLITWPSWPPRSYIVKTLQKSSSRVTLGLGMSHWWCRAYQVCSNNHFKLILTYVKSRSYLLPIAFKWENLWKVDFLNTVEAKVIILTWYVKPNETMVINKFQRQGWPLIFQPRSLIVESHQQKKNIVFSETTRPIKLKFYRMTPYDRFVKTYTNYSGHMIKMTTTHLYSKNL